MQLTGTWQKIAVARVVIQKHGLANVMLAYSAISPADEDDRFVLTHNEASIFPQGLGDLDLWARAERDSANITVIEFDEVVDIVQGAFSSGFSTGFGS